MEALEKKVSKIIVSINSNTTYSNKTELLTKIWESKRWKFYDFETSYNNWLKKIKF